MSADVLQQGNTGQRDGGGKSEEAKQKASELGQDAADAGQHVADVAKDQAGKVASEAGNQARNLLHDASGELRDQAAAQQSRVADGLRSVSKELSSMADNSGEQGVATDLVHQAADRTGSIAQWLDERDPGSLLDDVKSFARQRPGVFIAVAAGAGILAGRLTRNLAQPEDSSPSHGESTSGQNLASGQSSPSAPLAGSRYPGSAVGGTFAETDIIETTIDETPIDGTRTGGL